MTHQRLHTISDVQCSSAQAATKTPLYQTESTAGVVWVIKPGQTLPKHYHPNADDIWIILQGEGIFYPQPGEEIPFHAGQVIVSRKGECHGAKNTGAHDIVFVSITAPTPSGYEPIDEEKKAANI